MYSQFGTNSNARRKRVYYEGDSTIYEGMPVCYNYDATANILGYDKGAGGDVACQTTPGTTAEGNQNEGKFMLVEDPADNNIMHFAGVVAGTSNAGMTGPRWLDIYIPNGAIVPVRCDVDTTVGVTLLAITVDSQEFGYVLSGTSRIVALAMETETVLDTGTTGITLAKLSTDLVLYQDLDGTALSIGAAAGDTVVNQIRVSSAQTAGQFHPLYARADLVAGNTGHCEYGAFQFEMHLYQTAIGGHCNCLTAAAVLETGAVAAAGREVKAAEFSVEDWSAVAKANMSICPLKLATYISAAGTAPASHYMMMFNTLQTGDTPDAWFHAQNPESIAYTTGGDTGATKVGDIKISMQGGFGTGYIRVYDGIA